MGQRKELSHTADRFISTLEAGYMDAAALLPPHEREDNGWTR